MLDLSQAFPEGEGAHQSPGRLEALGVLSVVGFPASRGGDTRGEPKPAQPGGGSQSSGPTTHAQTPGPTGRAKNELSTQR